MSQLTLCFLGSPQIRVDGRPVELGRRKAVALLAYLAVTGQSHTRDALATLLWSELDQTRSRAALRRTLHTLNRELGRDNFQIDREAIRLASDADLSIDIAQFHSLLVECQSHGHPNTETCPACIPLVERAITLYAGDFMAGFTLPNSPDYDEWQFFQGERLRLEASRVLQCLIEAFTAQRDYDQAIDLSERWLAMDPLNEPAHRHLMQLFAWSGRPNAALHQYQTCAHLLKEELGVPPDPITQALYQSIKADRATPLPDTHAQTTRDFAQPLIKPERGILLSGRFIVHDLEADLLGRGGWGEVYRGLDTRSGRDVAIKILKPELVANGSDLVARFRLEGKALRQLNHPNIVQLITAINTSQSDKKEEANRPYLVLEYVKGGSVRTLLDREGSLTLARTLEIGLEVADALTRAHHLGILHRDLKPSNVLLAEDGTARLSDFGVAHLRQGKRLTEIGTLVGSLAYLSPEVCEGEELDPRTDIWSYGIMMYEMLTGKRPFRGESRAATVTAIFTHQVPDLSRCCPDLPTALADLVYRMLEKNRRQRVPSMRQVGAELEAISRDFGGQPSRASASPAIISGPYDTPTPTPRGPRHNLPVQATPFVGRQPELAQLARLLANQKVRLLTILGAGGTGKTRLALEAAANQLDSFRDGARFVSLAPLDSADAIVPALAEALGVPLYECVDPAAHLLNYLSRRNLLLILDNFEHLVREARQPKERGSPDQCEPDSRDGTSLVADIVKTTPEVKILVTSRAKLGIQGEHLFPMTGMPFPELPPQQVDEARHYGAIALFEDEARRARPDFCLQPDNLDAICLICQQLQGMPLGILLAAAWVQLLNPTEIAAEIAAEDGQGIDFLQSEMRDIPSRQRSLRAVFDHSWRLLRPSQRETIQVLSIFRGGFSREAGQEVSGASLRTLMILVERSFLQRTPTGRFQMHELLRQYAAQKLERSQSLAAGARDRHAAYYAAFLSQCDPEIKGARQFSAIDKIEAEIHNVQAAWSWAIEKWHAGWLQLAIDGLCQFYQWRGQYRQAEAACHAASKKLAVASEEPSDEVAQVLSRILTWEALFTCELGQSETAGRLLQRSLDLEKLARAGRDTRQERAFALHLMGKMAIGSNRREARRLLKQSLTLCQSLDDLWGQARALHFLAVIDHEQANYEKSRLLNQESLAIRQALGDRRGIADSTKKLAILAVIEGNLEDQDRLIQQNLKLRREIGDKVGMVEDLAALAATLLFQGRFEDAQPFWEEAVDLCDDLGMQSQMATANQFMGWNLTNLGAYEKAFAIMESSLTYQQEKGNKGLAAMCLLGLGELKMTGHEYAAAQELLLESLAMFRELGQRHEAALVAATIGYVLYKLGQDPQAHFFFREAFRAVVAGAGLNPALFAIGNIAPVLAGQGQPELAIELWALVSRYPYLKNSQYWADTIGRDIDNIASTLPKERVAAARERGQMLDLETISAVLLAEIDGWPASYS